MQAIGDNSDLASIAGIQKATSAMAFVKDVWLEFCEVATHKLTISLQEPHPGIPAQRDLNWPVRNAIS